MVSLTVYASAGSFDLSRYLSVSTVVTEANRRVTNVFLTDTDVYGATAFAQRKEGVWGSDLFLGATTISPTGRVGFAPEARLTSDGDGRTVGQIAASLVEHGVTGDALAVKLLKGDDVLTGGSHDDVLYGYSGRDILVGGNGDDRLFGGDGNDLILSGARGSGSTTGYAMGGGGNDIIVLSKGEYVASLNGEDGDDLIYLGQGAAGLVYGDRGDTAGHDTFYFSGTGDINLGDFNSVADTIELNFEYFTSLVDGVGVENIVYGDNTVSAKDTDDYILINTDPRYVYVVYFDPDGSGPQGRQQLFVSYSRQEITAANFEVAHLEVPTTPFASPLVTLGDQVNSHGAHWPADPLLNLV